ncbi:MAG: cysteine--tRNA ligase [Alphaproteobacteria bacterium]|nr:cysteine--tRNA ligase [Alphaproteobacteria bacterium]MBN2675214.1 cysteine--tRNA ligase [Alphaproteobacteria bacterium]
MTIKLYNTMSRKIEEFKPLIPNQVSFYSCGPTVYWNQHLGNMRTFISNDIIKRMFIENGFKVNHVMNYTDVGHLTSDADEGEDKMEKGAARENKSVWEVAQTYIDSVESDMKDLNLIKPITPRATDYIDEQIDLVKKLEDLGYTYIIPGKGVYYDTSKFADYGLLGGQNLSELRSGIRIDNDGKKNPTDFMLWAFSPKDKKREMEWDSPWGVGFPGWHIECSAMSMKLLGNHFDIHTGGQEHIKVHHSDEIAQSEPIVGKPWVNYWVHFAWLMAKDGKMSKSAGDSLTVPYIKNKGYDPMEFRYLMLLGHYRQPVDFSWVSLDAAANGYKNIVRKVADLIDSQNQNPEKENSKIYEEWNKKILDIVSDNIKTAESLVQVQELLKADDINSATKLKLFEFIDRLLGLQFINRAQKLLDLESVEAPENIKKMALERVAAKAEKDWVRADELRDKIDAAGWNVIDTKDGIKIIKKMA